MTIKTKGLFEALPNCMTLQDIIDYLDSRNYEERKQKEEYHELYEEGSIILDNHIKVECESKDRVQIYYTEFHRSPRITKDYILHQPSWLIVPTTYSNDVWVKGTIVCYFTQNETNLSDQFLGQFKCMQKIKRTYSGSTHCPYTDLTPDKLESMLSECIRNLNIIQDEITYGVKDAVNIHKEALPIIISD